MVIATEKPTETKKRFSFFQDPKSGKMLLRFERMTAQKFAETMALVKAFPRRKFDVNARAWIIDNCKENFDYLLKTFDSDDYSIEPDLLTHLKTEATPPENDMWEYVFDEDREIEIDYEPRLTSYRHQKLALKFMHESEYFGLIWEMGTGKTKVCIDELGWQIQDGRKIKALVICPKGILDNWQDEIDKHLPNSIEYYCETLGTGEKCIDQLREGLSYNVPLRIWICAVDRIKANLAALQAMRFDVAFLDESHRIKDHRTKRSKAAIQLAPYIKRRFVLSGTFVGNTPSDMWAQTEFLKTGVMGSQNWNHFSKRYDHISLEGGAKAIARHDSMRTLKERLSKFSLIVKKSECLDLPEKTYSVYKVDMTTNQRVIYNQMADFLFAEMESEGTLSASRAQIYLVQMLRLAQICGGYLNTEHDGIKEIPGGNPKLEGLEEILDDQPEENRFLIWCRFTQDLKKVSDLLTKMGISFGAINGPVPMAERHRLAKSFNNPNGIRCLICEPGSAGEGLTLVGTKDRPCALAVRFSSDFSIIKREQSEDRCHRIGMHRSVHYIDLICNDSIEEGMLDILKQKKDLGRAIKDVSHIKKFLGIVEDNE